MSTPTPTATPTTFPSDWTTDANGNPVAPDGNIAVGDVKALFVTTFAQVDTLTAEVAAGGSGTGTGTGPTQAAFDALNTQVQSMVATQTTTQKAFADLTTALDAFAAAITAQEPVTTPPVTPPTPITA